MQALRAQQHEHRGVRATYGCNGDALAPALRQAFVTTTMDAETRSWIDDCIARPNGSLSVTAQALARRVMSDYDANGLVGTHDMRVLGTAQWRRVLGDSIGRLLDVGAGDGHVTETLAPLASSITAIETSRNMAKRLRKRGWTCHEVDLATEPFPDADARFDCVALLNVIDRTARPITLLERLKPLLGNKGRLVVAVPFPLRPHVHVGPITVDPEELLPIAEGWEAQASTLAQLVFSPTGYQVEALTRAPYLCRGDREHPVAVLDDAVFVLRGS